MKYTNGIVFLLGAAVGSVATWYGVKKHYEQIAQEAIDSVKAVYSSRKVPKYEGSSTSDEEKTEIHGAFEKDSDIMEYAKRLSQEGYTNYSNSESVHEQPSPAKTGDFKSPYVIEPEQFGEFDDYDQISLTYYADGVLADDNDQLVEDVVETVGPEALSHFGEFDDDSVYVRNERLRVDYEILRDLRTYDDVLESKPYLKEHR